jgi:hypothetical protein
MKLDHSLIGWRGEKLEFIGAMKRDHEIYIHGLKKLLLEVDEKIVASISGIDGSELFLLLTKRDKDRIVGLIDGLGNSAGPGHQYLNTKGQAIEIMLSKDEYPLPDNVNL